MANPKVWSGGTGGWGGAFLQGADYSGKQTAMQSAQSQMSPQVTGPSWGDDYAALQESERRGVLGRFSKLRQAMEKSFNRRGIQRSGFAGEGLTQLQAEQQGALAEVESGLTERLQNYKFQQQQLEYMKKMADAQKQKSSDGGWLGTALGIGGSLVGGLIRALSSERFKHEILPMPEVSGALAKIRGVTWRWNGSGNPAAGVIAENVARNLPQAALYTDDGTVLGVDYGKLTAMLVEGFREQKARLDRLEAARVGGA